MCSCEKVKNQLEESKQFVVYSYTLYINISSVLVYMDRILHVTQSLLVKSEARNVFWYVFKYKQGICICISMMKVFVFVVVVEILDYVFDSNSGYLLLLNKLSM